MAEFLYEVGWDQIKARINFNKHGVDFERAATCLWFTRLKSWQSSTDEFD